MIYLQLFIIFFVIGVFGFGGGYGILSLIQGEVVQHHHWLNASEFTDIVAISQSAPGPIGLNSATYCGYAAIHNAGYNEMMSILGSSIAAVAFILPSFIIVIIISKMFIKYMNTPEIESIFSGLRPAIVGILAATTLLLMTPENFNTPKVNPWYFWISIGLFISTFIGIKYMKIHPTRMILYSGFAGLLLLY